MYYVLGQQLMTCPDCQGTGESFTPCGTCGGDGRVRKSKRISLRVPAGVDTGSRLRVRGEGNSGRRGKHFTLVPRPDNPGGQERLETLLPS